MLVIENNKARVKCDAEIGKPGNWRGCNRTAQWKVIENPARPTTRIDSLDYCSRHVEARIKPGFEKYHGIKDPVKLHY